MPPLVSGLRSGLLSGLQSGLNPTIDGNGGTLGTLTPAVMQTLTGVFPSFMWKFAGLVNETELVAGNPLHELQDNPVNPPARQVWDVALNGFTMETRTFQESMICLDAAPGNFTFNDFVIMWIGRIVAIGADFIVHKSGGGSWRIQQFAGGSQIRVDRAGAGGTGTALLAHPAHFNPQVIMGTGNGANREIWVDAGMAAVAHNLDITTTGFLNVGGINGPLARHGAVIGWNLPGGSLGFNETQRSAVSDHLGY